MSDRHSWQTEKTDDKKTAPAASEKYGEEFYEDIGKMGESAERKAADAMNDQTNETERRDRDM